MNSRALSTFSCDIARPVSRWSIRWCRAVDRKKGGRHVQVALDWTSLSGIRAVRAPPGEPRERGAQSLAVLCGRVPESANGPIASRGRQATLPVSQKLDALRASSHTSASVESAWASRMKRPNRDDARSNEHAHDDPLQHQARRHAQHHRQRHEPHDTHEHMLVAPGPGRIARFG